MIAYFKSGYVYSDDPMIESIDHVDITAQKEAGKIYTLLVLTSMLH